MIEFLVFTLLLQGILYNNDYTIKSYALDKYEINIDELFSTYKISDNELKYVAHAGGKLDNKYTYVNCLESIENSYQKGFRLIEMDVEFTSDNKPVMLHSWDGFITSFFKEESDKIYSYKQFENFNMINDWHQLTLDDVIYYMDTKYKKMYLVTDTKNDNKKLLDIISNEYNYMMDRIIPQVYNQDEYEYAKNLGFKNIIYTLYLSEDSKEQIVDFCIKNHPFAITMSTSWAYTDLPILLSNIGTYTYAHTINDNNEYEILKQNGIKGIYTDVLFNN